MTTPVAINVSRNFLNWLFEENINIALTTYQTNRLFLIGRKADGELSAFERLLDRPMGLFADSESLYVSTRYLMWRLDNVLGPGELHDESFDKLYIPRNAHTTGDLDIHDVVIDRKGHLIFANTAYSCLAALSQRHSFEVFWKPPFISELVPEDRCHLNGIAMVDGEIRYATSISRSDVASGWRKRRESGGCLFDVQKNEIILDNLSMPHSPRWYNGKLWLFNSGKGELGFVDLKKQKFEPICFCPGYLRGLAFHKNYAIVGLSKTRKRTELSDLELDRRLRAKDSDAICGVMVIDLNTGSIAHWLEFTDVITELYDVQLLPNVSRSMLFGFMSNEISRSISFEENGKITRHTITSSHEPIDFFTPEKKPPQNDISHKTQVVQNQTPIKFQLSTNMTFQFLKDNFDHLLFKAFAKRAELQAPKEPLFAVIAMFNGQVIGMALAEMFKEDIPAEIVSLFVSPGQRKKGIATQLVANLEKVVKKAGCPKIDLVWNEDYPSADAVERIIQKLGWLPPQKTMLIHKISVAELVKADWVQRNYKLPKDYSIFLWKELTEKEREEITESQQQKEWFPPYLTPFQMEDQIEWRASFGLRNGNKVVGWVIGFRNSSDTVQISCFFVCEEERRKKWTLALLANFFNSLNELDIPYVHYQADYKNKYNVKLFRNLIKSAILSESITLASRKYL
ncbi:N-acetyltransferase domain-containing protein [Candidatus Magnetomoraceae bacterium gMMP-15]